MKLNSKISVAAVVFATLFSGVASADDFTNITSGSAEVNIAEKSVVLMNITPKAGLVSGPAKAGMALASFQASSSNTNGSVAIRWGIDTATTTNNGGAIVVNKDVRGAYLMLRIDTPDLKAMREGWYVNGQSRINGNVVLQNDTNIVAGTYNINLDAASYTL